MKISDYLSDKGFEYKGTEPPTQRQIEDAEYWRKEGLATAKYDICNRCGQRYWLENPECVNAKIHGPKN